MHGDDAPLPALARFRIRAGLVWRPARPRRPLPAEAQIGLAIETACGGQPQDIEGVVGEDGETVHVVQTRPQVLSHNSYWY